MKNSHSPSPLIAARARHHRFHLTPSETALWRALSGRRLLGVQFRRQVPIAGSRFIVDFLAPREKLVVEIDGGYHARRKRADARRDARLRRLGYRVLRVSADEVLRNLPVVVMPPSVPSSQAPWPGAGGPTSPKPVLAPADSAKARGRRQWGHWRVLRAGGGSGALSDGSRNCNRDSRSPT